MPGTIHKFGTPRAGLWQRSTHLLNTKHSTVFPLSIWMLLGSERMIDTISTPLIPDDLDGDVQGPSVAAKQPSDVEARAAAAAEAATRAAAQEMATRHRRIPVREDYFLPEDAEADGAAAAAASEGVLVVFTCRSDAASLGSVNPTQSGVWTCILCGRSLPLTTVSLVDLAWFL